MTEALKKHYEWKGKIEIRSKVKLDTLDDLSLAYTPGVADACLAIKDNPELSYSLTGRGNQVAVITDGSAILGLGNIGPIAGMPVMEGKSVLFKEYGGIDAIPLCINSNDVDEIVRTVKLLEGNFAGINLEDISAPRCFEVETRLKKELNIPVFHDDQHGTAICVGAALINALKIVNKKIEDVTVSMSGAGAAGTAICKYLIKMGVKNVIVSEMNKIINRDEKYPNKNKNELAMITNKDNIKGDLSDAMRGSDVFVGVSAGNIVTIDMVKSMAKDSIVFALANPISEINYNDAKKAGAKVVGTGSSKYPNQVNNALVFPGLFRGAIDAKASDITFDMMKAASLAISSMIKDEELNETNLLPKVIDKEVHKRIALKVKEAWKENVII